MLTCSASKSDRSIVPSLSSARDLRLLEEITSFGAVPSDAEAILGFFFLFPSLLVFARSLFPAVS